MAMSSPRRHGRSRFTIGLLVLFSITVLTLDFRDVGFVQDARHAAGSALSPLQGAADHVATPFQNTWNGITGYDDLAEENRALRAQLEELEGSAVQDEDAAEQLAELLDQVDIPWVGSLSTATARVIQQPPTAFSHIVVIDKGSSAGIKDGMPVVTGAGLVGRIVDVSSNRSSVQLITDPEFRVGIRLVTSQRLGTAKGQGSSRALRIDTGIEPEEDAADIEEGEKITTSGIDDRSSFPASIPVAAVVRTAKANGGLTLEVFADPLADLDRLSFVNVLLSTPVA